MPEQPDVFSCNWWQQDKAEKLTSSRRSVSQGAAQKTAARKNKKNRAALFFFARRLFALRLDQLNALKRLLKNWRFVFAFLESWFTPLTGRTFSFLIASLRGIFQWIFNQYHYHYCHLFTPAISIKAVSSVAICATARKWLKGNNYTLLRWAIRIVNNFNYFFN